MREQIIAKVKEKKIVVIVRGVFGEDAVKLAKALHDGGITMMEFTFDQKDPASHAKTADAIRCVKEAMGDAVLVGAGTVTDLKMLQLAKDAGAAFIVSPDTNPEVIGQTVAQGMVSMPGALTPTEILTAYRAGADFVKVFPISNLGAAYLKAVKAPLNHVPLLAVGGVNENNVADFIKAGAEGVGVGGNLVNKEWIKNGEFDKITALARLFIQNIQKG